MVSNKIIKKNRNDDVFGNVRMKEGDEGKVRGTGKQKGFCALISVDIRNAFNSARWKICWMEDLLSELEVKWSRSPKYLGVQLDRRLSFGEHLRIATAKAIRFGANLARLMLNIGGPREAKRRLVASVVYSKLLYMAPAWASTINSHAILKKLFSAQRGVALRVISAYRTVSTSTVPVLASVPPIDLLARER